MLEAAKRVLPLLFFYGIHLAAAAVTGGDGDEFVYSGFAAGGSNLTLDGTAKVTPTGLLELTNGTAQSKGHAFHPTPLRLRRRSFSATFVFGIVPAAPGGGVGAGHGLALVVSPTKDLSSGVPTSYLGLLNGTRFLAVELDTVMSPEFHDEDNNHVGVDVDTLVSAAAASAGYYDDGTGEFRSLTLVSGDAMQAWVDYDGDAGRVDVRLAPIRSSGTKPTKPLVSAEVYLSTVVGEEAYVGFSSSTGTLTSRHYVLGWSFAVGKPAPAIDMAKLPKLPRQSSKSRSKTLLAIVLPVVAGVLALAVASCVLLLVRRRYRYVELREDWEVEFGAHRISYKDLFHATDGFQSKNLLGAGGFGTVYRGTLAASGTEVAVKRVAHGSQQGMKEFVAEVVTVGRLRHRNLVQLLGYCRLNDELLLAYEYMANGSLEKHLYGGGGGGPTLSWAQRFQVIKGVASGLLYLHEEWEQAVVHRDVKASNILLDGDMNARLGDFGLARLHNHDGELHTTVVAGTFGYIAPELALTGKASPLTDVYAFGAFLLEVVTGRRPVEDAMDGNRVMLVDWVLEQWRNESLAEAVDPRIQGGYDVDEVRLALRVGLMCSHPLAGVRPGMRQVMQYLAGDTPLPELTPAHVGMSMLALLQHQLDYSFAMASSYSSASASAKSFDTNLSRGR